MSAATLTAPPASWAPEVRAWPVPVSEPHPAASAPLAATGPAALQDVLPLSAPRPRAAAPRRAPRVPSWSDDGPRATPSAELPDPEVLVRTVATLSLEALSGCRPVAQLMRWTTPEVYAALSERAAAAARRRRPGAAVQRTSVLRLSSSAPRDGAVEAAVVVTVGPRVRAMAVRLEGWDGRWRVTALELG